MFMIFIIVIIIFFHCYSINIIIGIIISNIGMDINTIRENIIFWMSTQSLLDDLCLKAILFDISLCISLNICFLCL